VKCSQNYRYPSLYPICVLTSSALFVKGTFQGAAFVEALL